MAEDTEERYDIAFAGECLDGQDPETVRAALGKLFKADAATLERLFSGTRQRIKANCDRATALKYQKSLAHVGAKAIVTRASVATPPPATSPARPAVAETDAAAAPDARGPSADDDFELLPGGSDILRPEERVSHGDAAVDLSHLSLAETGDRLSETVVEATPAVTVPDFAVAEPGARMGPQDDAPPPPAPDTSSLDLAPTGADLSDGEAENTESAPVNTDHLDLAESGSDLLNPEERSVNNAQAPDTSHLTLDTEDDSTKS